MARYDDAKQEYARLVHWLGQRNQEALASLEEAEKKFRIIRGYREISSFLDELKKFNLKNELKVA